MIASSPPALLVTTVSDGSTAPTAHIDDEFEIVLDDEADDENENESNSDESSTSGSAVMICEQPTSSTMEPPLTPSAAARWFGPDIVDEYASDGESWWIRPYITGARPSALTARRYPSPPNHVDQQSSNKNDTMGSEATSSFMAVLNDTSGIQSTSTVVTDRFGFITIKPHVLSDGSSTNVSRQNITDKQNADDSGNASTTPPSILDVRTLVRREQKWLAMLLPDKWSQLMNKHFDVVRRRCRKGIPPSLRGRVWTQLCGAVLQLDSTGRSDVYDRLCRDAPEETSSESIDKDLARQFPQHELFARDSHCGQIGQSSLRSVLGAYCVAFPDDGYCQGQAPVAATLLMHMPPSHAYHCLVQICRHYLKMYYAPGLEQIQLDGRILHRLLKRKSPVTYKLFKRYDIEPSLYMIEWFMCIYCRTLPWNIVLRVWDMFFCEGVKILFKVAIVLLRGALGSSAQARSCEDMYSVLERLRNIRVAIKQEEQFVQAVTRVEISEDDFKKAHYKELKLMRKQKRMQNK